ncbi:hypothetical protein RFI_09692 [Reticulomyxa filosa]|uniref:Aspartyl/asparaginy/proline hydroxylase domain-containing protein n=1 Tax=Reticulomyxa filosa TaxID=46433 RepID=X6NP35_RETFI|nr:hypothetical protein RFI_09692 [Reticulomyxa filosa]|eukprot:ETO27439.1 hypothetical protein RFI_09692 [Reticulomyxa filosa]
MTTIEGKRGGEKKKKPLCTQNTAIDKNKTKLDDINAMEITVFLARFFPPSEKAVHDTAQFEFAKKFRENHEVIYQEYLDFEEKYNYAPQMDDVYPNGSITNWDKKWPTVTLRCYGLDSQISKFFPKTMALVNQSEYWLSHVMYSILDPNKFIPRHRGFF